MPKTHTKTRGAPRPEETEAAPLVPLGALAVALIERCDAARPLVHVARDARRLETLAATLRALAPGLGVALYPEWDCLPHDRTSPSRAVMGARAGVLRWLTDARSRPHLVLTTAPALIQRVAPPEVWAEARVEIRVGDALDAEALGAALARLGYQLDERVDEPGEFAVRGRTLDVFPAAAPRPCRVEHDGARVTAIRSYDPLTQRSLAQTETLVIDAATEIVLPPDAAERPKPFTGEEHRLARYYARLVGVLDALPEARLVVEEGAEARAEAFFEQIAEARETSGRGRVREEGDASLYATPAQWQDLVRERRLAEATREAAEPVTIPVFAADARPVPAFAKALKDRLRAGDRILLAGPASVLPRLVRQAERAAERKAVPAADWAAVAAATPGTLMTLAGPVQAGFRAPEAGVTVFAAADLLGQDVNRGADRPAGGAALLLGDVDLHVGDVAVDRDHGLCVFEGLAAVETGAGGAHEAVRLRFANGAIRLVPLAQADRIWRYGADEEAVSLDRLENGTWGRRRLEAEAGLARMARAMVALARERAAAKAEALVPPGREMERFAAGFGFGLTGDQAAAIDGALADLAAGRPMDRLVCGDVGFGKTEVALRAAAAAVFAGRQVAVVAPTTVLARQHVETFTRRFARFGIAVGHLSRLVSPAEAKRVKAGLADGSLRLVVGTQALAGRAVRFHDLGLTVIDEEQRFGTKTKEALRTLGGQAHGHVLTLTATPIPRTLQTALAGLQSLSVIATPPVVRQPIRTHVGPFDGEAVRAALLREQARGGQSFVVCPRVEDIEPLRARLAALAPDLAVVVAHGAMKPAAMDEAMVRFAQGEGDVLLATSIIESGLDVPRANTMIVTDPERFGLAQLHQLRGRVGRGQRRGTVHLLVDPERPLSAGAEKRLRTLEAFDRLGAGFAISTRDLDLRGAGEIVGDSQAGHVTRVGLGLHQHLLGLALRAARGEAAEDWAPEIRLGLEGGVPVDYVPEPELRLSVNQRALRLRTPDEVATLRAEIEDRFGPLPEAVEALLATARLRVACAALGVAQLSGGPQGIAADFRADPPLVAVGQGVERSGRRILLRPGDGEARARARLAEGLLKRIRDEV